MNKIEKLFRNLFPILILLFASGTIWGPLFFPILYTGFALVYSIIFSVLTLLLAYRYSVTSKTRRISDKKPITKHEFDYKHLIIIPNYKESIQTLKATIRTLGDHLLAQQYIVCLAMEESEEKHKTKALMLITEFEDKFEHMLYTVHPQKVEGEMAGKASNVNYAARQCYSMFKEDNIIVTISDADTIFNQRYFLDMDAAMSEDDKNIMFAPPVLFNRNSLNVPSVVRITDIQWCCFAYATFGIYDGIGFPMSVYSLPMELAHRVDFWDTCASAIGEDMHMFLKCFFSTHGDLSVKTIPFPVSQTNVEGDTFVDTIYERYTQANRHALGLQDTPYCWAQSTQTKFPANYTTKWTAVILLMFTIQFMPITNVFLLTALNYLPYVQPLYQTTAMIVMWKCVNTIITGSSFLAFLIVSISYQKTHNMLSIEREQRQWYHMVMDGFWVPVSATLFFVIPVIRACILLLFGSDLLSKYDTSKKPNFSLEK